MLHSTKTKETVPKYDSGGSNVPIVHCSVFNSKAVA
jgi:hypothetical protein